MDEKNDPMNDPVSDAGPVTYRVLVSGGSAYYEAENEDARIVFGCGACFGEEGVYELPGNFVTPEAPLCVFSVDGEAFVSQNGLKVPAEWIPLSTRRRIALAGIGAPSAPGARAVLTGRIRQVGSNVFTGPGANRAAGSIKPGGRTRLSLALPCDVDRPIGWVLSGGEVGGPDWALTPKRGGLRDRDVDWTPKAYFMGVETLGLRQLLRKTGVALHNNDEGVIEARAVGIPGWVWRGRGDWLSEGRMIAIPRGDYPAGPATIAADVWYTPGEAVLF